MYNVSLWRYHAHVIAKEILADQLYLIIIIVDKKDLETSMMLSLIVSSLSIIRDKIVCYFKLLFNSCYSIIFIHALLSSYERYYMMLLDIKTII